MKNEKKASEFECRQTWAFGGPVSRRTLSRDGIVFDKIRMIFYDHGLNFGGHFQTGGPADIQNATVDRNIWVAYSISKQQIGVSRMPIASLDE